MIFPAFKRHVNETPLPSSGLDIFSESTVFDDILCVAFLIAKNSFKCGRNIRV